MERCKRPLFLHKDEWNRVLSVGAPTRAPCTTNEYVQPLIEKSQNLINSWPDSVQGHITKLEKQKEKQRATDLAMIKLFRKKQKETFKKNECIEKAKEIIFDDSCYGRRLISALLESKTLEERDVQVEFQKKIRQRAEAQDVQQDAFGCSLQNAIIMENQEREQETSKRKKDKEVAQVNMTIYLTQSEYKKKEKERQKQIVIEDLHLIEKNIEQEKAEQKNKNSLFYQDLEQFLADQKKLKEEKAIREDEEERKAEIWTKYEERKNTIIKTIHANRFEKLNSAENFELVKKLNDDEKNRYDEFVNKGIAALTRKLQINEEEDNRKREDERRTQHLLLQSNKKLEDIKRMTDDVNKCTCDRHYFLNTNCDNARRTTLIARQQDISKFAPLKNSLVKNLKVKEKEPSPWSGGQAAHAQFASRAADTLQQCRYKQAARRVVNDYRRLNGLTDQSLPISNYF